MRDEWTDEEYEEFRYWWDQEGYQEFERRERMAGAPEGELR